MVADPGVGETVLADLTRFRIRVDVNLEPDNRDLIEVWGPEAHRMLTGEGLAPSDGWHAEPFVACLRFASDSVPRYLIAAELAPRLVDTGAVVVGSQATEAVRIELGEPRVGTDVDEKTIPQEADLVADTVDFTKGCYLGQELVARIDSRGHVNRHLRGIVLRDSVLPPVPAELVAGDKVVGSLTSLAESLDLRAPIGLALVRREVAPGSDVEIRWKGGVAHALVHELPLK